MNLVTPNWVASPTLSPERLKNVLDMKPGRWCWDSSSAFDRVLATRYGLGAIDMVHRGEFGCMAALRSNKIVSISLREAISKNRVVDNEMIQIVDGLFEEIGVKEAASQ